MSSSYPPSYQDSLTTNPPHPQPHRTQASHLHAQLTTTRTTHITNLITTSILPLIHDRAATGLSTTNIVLIPISPSPSSATTTTLSPSSIQISHALSSSSSAAAADDDLQPLPLTHLLDTPQFWSQPPVITQLHHLLGQSLAAQGYGTWKGDDDGDSEKTSAAFRKPDANMTATTTTPRPKPRSLFSSSSKKSSLPTPTPTPTPEPPRDSDHDRVSVHVTPDEVCLRTQSAFGLYETVTRPALLVRVEIRA